MELNDFGEWSELDQAERLLTTGSMQKQPPLEGSYGPSKAWETKLSSQENRTDQRR